MAILKSSISNTSEVGGGGGGDGAGEGGEVKFGDSMDVLVLSSVSSRACSRPGLGRLLRADMAAEQAARSRWICYDIGVLPEVEWQRPL